LESEVTPPVDLSSYNYSLGNLSLRIDQVNATIATLNTGGGGTGLTTAQANALAVSSALLGPTLTTPDYTYITGRPVYISGEFGTDMCGFDTSTPNPYIANFNAVGLTKPSIAASSFTWGTVTAVTTKANNVFEQYKAVSKFSAPGGGVYVLYSTGAWLAPLTYVNSVPVDYISRWNDGADSLVAAGLRAMLLRGVVEAVGTPAAFVGVGGSLASYATDSNTGEEYATLVTSTYMCFRGDGMSADRLLPVLIIPNTGSADSTLTVSFSTIACADPGCTATDASTTYQTTGTMHCSRIGGTATVGCSKMLAIYTNAARGFCIRVDSYSDTMATPPTPTTRVYHPVDAPTSPANLPIVILNDVAVNWNDSPQQLRLFNLEVEQRVAWWRNKYNIPFFFMRHALGPESQVYNSGSQITCPGRAGIHAQVQAVAKALSYGTPFKSFLGSF